MKNIIKQLFIFSMLFVVGCSTEDILNDDIFYDDATQEESGEQYQITASIATDTKVAINGYSVTWEVGDKMQIFKVSDSGAFVDSNITFEIMAAEDITEDGKNATFTGSGLSVDTEYIAFAGGATMTYSDGKVTTNLQSATSLDDVDLLMVSESFELSTLDSGMNIFFENKCSIFQVAVDVASGVTFSSTSAVFTSTGNIYSSMSYSADGTVAAVKTSATSVSDTKTDVDVISPDFYVPVYCNETTADIVLSAYNAAKDQYATKTYSSVDLNNGLLYDAVTLSVTASNLFTELTSTYVEDTVATSTILSAVTSNTSEEETVSITSKTADGEEVTEEISVTVTTISASEAASIASVQTNQAVVSEIADDGDDAGEMEILVIKSMETDDNGDVTIATTTGNITNLFRDTEFTLGLADIADVATSKASTFYTPSEVGVVSNGTYSKIYDTRAYSSISSSIDGINQAIEGTGITSTITSNSFDIGLDFNMSFQFGRDLTYPEQCRGELESLNCYFWGTLDMDLLASYVATANSNMSSDELIEELDAISMTYYVDGVPVAIKITPAIYASSDVSVSGATSFTASCSIAGDLSFGINYNEGATSNVYSYFTDGTYSNYSFSSIYPEITVKSSVSSDPAAKSSIETRFDISYYGLKGPSISVKPYVGVRNTTGSITYDSKTFTPFKNETSAGIEVDASINEEFISNTNNSDWWKSYTNVKETFDETPNSISLVSPSESESVIPSNEIEVVFETTAEAVVKFTDESGNLLGYATADEDGQVSYTWTATVDGVLNAAVIDDTEVAISSSSYAPIVTYNDRALLLAIYEANGGANWVNADTWNTTAPISEWEGVTLNTAGRVTELNFMYLDPDSSYNTYLGFGLTGALDVTEFDELTSLYVSSNSITSINASGCTKLKMLYANSNSEDDAVKLSYVDLTGVEALTGLYIEYNAISTTDLAKLNLDAFTESLIALNIGSSTNSIDYTKFKNIKYLTLSYMLDIESFDVAEYPNLNSLYMNGCSNLKELKGVTANTNLQYLYLQSTNLSELNLSGCTSLSALSTNYVEGLSTVNLEGCSALRTASFSYCNLTSVNFTGCSSLWFVYLYDNTLLESVDVSAAESLMSIYLYGATALKEVRLYTTPTSNLTYTSWGDYSTFLYTEPSHMDNYQYPLFIYTSNGVTLPESGAYIDYTAQTVTINPIITAESFNVGEALDWVTVSTDDDNVVTVTCDKNDTGAARTGYIVFTSGEYKESFSLTQDYERVPQLDDLEKEEFTTTSSSR